VKKYFIFILLIFSTFTIFSQKNVLIDSLVLEINKTNDSAKVDVYNSICWNLRNSKPNEAIEYGKLAIELAQKLEYHKGIIQAYSFIGVSYRNLGNYNQAFEYYFNGLEKALKYNLLDQQGYAYNNLGNLFIYQEYYDKAVQNLISAFEISLKINNQKLLAYSSLNLGRAYLMKYKFDSSLVFLEKAYNIRQELKDNQGKAVCLKYIADVYNEQKLFDKSYNNYKEALETADFENDKDLLADIYNKLALLYLNKLDYQQAQNYAKQSLDIAFKIGLKLRFRDSYKTLANISIATKDWQNATNYQSYVIKYNDSLFNQQLTEKITNLQFEAEKHKTQIEIDLLNKEKIINDISLKRQQILNITLIFILLFSVAILILVIFANIQRKKANELLKKQKNEIELKNIELNSQNEEIKAQHDEIFLQKKQITDSIQYARRIQKAILQHDENLKIYIPNSFIYIEPRDIVSGDFFWYTKIENHVILAVADCTGHGVPGAFMSLLGVSALKEIIEDRQITQPNLVLEQLRKKIKLSLNQSAENSENKDGMDISFAKIDLNNKIIEYAGANSSAYIIRNKEIIVLEAVKNPIGIFINEKSFETITQNIEQNDIIYLFTDGYHSQFGGEKNEKFKLGRFKNLLIEIHELPIEIQKQKLITTIKQWQGGLKQVDDILIIGIKI